MAYISRHFIEKLVAQVDIVDIIDKAVPLKKKGHHYVACCPFHNEKTPSFTVFQNTQTYHCFGCGASGNVISFLTTHRHLDFVEAVEELAAYASLEIEYDNNVQANSAPKEDFSPLYALMTQIATYFQTQLYEPHAEMARDYLNKRGLTRKIGNKLQLGYAPMGWDNLLNAFGDSKENKALLIKLGMLSEKEAGKVYDRFRHRIMFPIHDLRGRVIAFGGRTLNENKKEAKYLNSPETVLFKKSQTLYNGHYVRTLRDAKNVIIVEGYMDVAALMQFGIENVVATLGTSTTTEHLKKLFRSYAELVFCFDGDDAGRKAAWKALENSLSVLESGRHVKFMFLPQNEDPDSFIRQYGRATFLEQVKHAMPLSQFLFEQKTQSLNLNTPEGQASLVKAVKPLLEKLPAGTYADLMWHKLNELTPHANLKKSTTLSNNIQRNKSHTTFTKPKDKLSLAEKAIRLLLLNPQLAKTVRKVEKLHILQIENIILLEEILEFIGLNPHVNTGMILAHYQGTPSENLIRYFMNQNYLLSSEEMQREFNSMMEKLYQHYDEQRYQMLLQNFSALTEVEKQELQSLYQRVRSKQP